MMAKTRTFVRKMYLKKGKFERKLLYSDEIEYTKLPKTATNDRIAVDLFRRNQDLIEELIEVEVKEKK